MALLAIVVLVLVLVLVLVGPLGRGGSLCIARI
jgi:hypothetical protein